MTDTRIEWADRVWNPVVGCSVVSPGCSNCYAMRMAARLERMQPGSHYDGITRPGKAGAVWTGLMAPAPDRALEAPLRRRKPTTYFVNSMGDLFHEGVPVAWVDRVFAVMALAPQHRFLILTKRANRMRLYLRWRDGLAHPALCSAINDIPAPLGNRRGALSMPLPNVWLGVSVEDQARADQRIPHLLETPAAKRFISAEPLLGEVDLTRIVGGWPGGWRHDGAAVDALAGLWRIGADAPNVAVGCNRLDWLICGGESGPGARAMHPDWARGLRDQCQAAEVPFFFKQWGNHDAGGRRTGKKAAGRLLDGVLHDAMPWGLRVQQYSKKKERHHAV